MTVSRTVGRENVEGAQNIRGSWRIYLLSRKARLELLTKQFIIVEGQKFQLFDKNPTVAGQGSPDELREKIIIRDLPSSLSNQEIERYLISKGVNLTSDLHPSK